MPAVGISLAAAGLSYDDLAALPDEVTSVRLRGLAVDLAALFAEID